MEYKELRKKYPVFIYKKYSFNLVGNDLSCNFNYKIDPGLDFNHEVIINEVDPGHFAKLNLNALENLVFHLGLAEIPSYWKATCSPKINIEAGYLTDEQIGWWRKLFMMGMMQYFYQNKIDFTVEQFLEIQKEKELLKVQKAETDNSLPLIPVGGGKDSTVTLDVISKNFKDVGALIIKPTTENSYSVVSTAGVKQVVTIERKIDKKILELNSLGYLNGHIPYSAVLYFSNILAAYVYGYSEVLFSNENSSNESNISYLGEEVNHQYSKTFEFENDFREYNSKYLSNINLFSFLRPLYEIQISKVFTKMEKYFHLIRSCNIGQKEGIWCRKCPKCLSTYILLHPFLGTDKTEKMFGHNLFENAELKDLLIDLIDEKKIKPFECVGTRLELKIALNMSLKIYGKSKLPILLEVFRNSKMYNQKLLDKNEKIYLKHFGANNLPEEFETILKSNI